MARRRILLSVVVMLLLAGALAACGNGSRASNDTCGSLHPGSGNFSDIYVTLSDGHIMSAITTFASGQTYHFVVTNTGKSVHEFMIAPPLSAMASLSADRKLALVDYQNIQPGARVKFDIDFSQASSGPGLEFASHDGNDYQQGMHMAIKVD